MKMYEVSSLLDDDIYVLTDTLDKAKILQWNFSLEGYDTMIQKINVRTSVTKKNKVYLAAVINLSLSTIEEYQLLSKELFYNNKSNLPYIDNFGYYKINDGDILIYQQYKYTIENEQLDYFVKRQLTQLRTHFIDKIKPILILQGQI